MFSELFSVFQLNIIGSISVQVEISELGSETIFSTLVLLACHLHIFCVGCVCLCLAWLTA